MQAIDDQDWIAVDALADRYGVSKRAVQKRVAKFREAGRLSVRQEGKSFKVHGPTYDQLVADAFDPAQELRNRHVKRRPGEAGEALPIEPRQETAPEPSRFNDAAAREKNAKAELAEMQLAQKRGELIPVREIEAAAIETGTKITQRLNAMKAVSGRLYAAARGGEEALHIELLAVVNAAIAAVGEDMAQLAARGATDPDQAQAKS
jgi:DNA-binding transcriptional ArsR family regulator